MREPFRKQGNPETKARWADLTEDQETEEVYGVNEVTAPPVRDSDVGVLDTACRMSVGGSAWFDDYKSKLADLGLLDYVKEEPERERYRFGDGRIVKSYKKATFPIVMCGQPLLATCSIVESDTLGLLLGKDFQEHNKVDMSILAQGGKDRFREDRTLGLERRPPFGGPSSSTLEVTEGDPGLRARGR